MHGSHHVGQAPLPLHLLFDNLHQQPGYHNYPNLNLYVLIVSKEVFQWEVLLQAFEQRPSANVCGTPHTGCLPESQVIGKKGYSAFVPVVLPLGYAAAFMLSRLVPFTNTTCSWACVRGDGSVLPLSLAASTACARTARRSRRLL